MPNPDPHTFTLAQARAMLPRVDALLLEMQAEQHRMREAQAVIDALRRSATGNGGTTHSDTREGEKLLRRHAGRLHELAGELEEMGVQIKDLARGLVDWVAEHDGHPVLLCWLQGETDIGWWHEIADGFAGRRAIVPAEWD